MDMKVKLRGGPYDGEVFLVPASVSSLSVTGIKGDARYCVSKDFTSDHDDLSLAFFEELGPAVPEPPAQTWRDRPPLF